MRGSRKGKVVPNAMAKTKLVSVSGGRDDAANRLAGEMASDSRFRMNTKHWHIHSHETKSWNDGGQCLSSSAGAERHPVANRIQASKLLHGGGWQEMFRIVISGGVEEGREEKEQRAGAERSARLNLPRR